MKKSIPYLIILILLVWIIYPKQDQPVDLTEQEKLHQEISEIKKRSEKRIDSLNQVLLSNEKEIEYYESRYQYQLHRNRILEKKLIPVNYTKQHLDSIAVNFRYAYRIKRDSI